MTKTIEIFAGPNGSGKTTFGEKTFAKRKDVIYLNPDKIAAGLSINGGDVSQFEAGRILFRKVDDCLARNISFAFETTMSGKVWLSIIKKAKKQGYKINIYFLFVQTIDLSLKRIKKRVSLGGHDIPKSVVKRRFRKTFNNFINLYSPLADEWFIIDNSFNGNFIAQKKNKKTEIFDKTIFKNYFE